MGRINEKIDHLSSLSASNPRTRTVSQLNAGRSEAFKRKASAEELVAYFELLNVDAEERNDVVS